MDKKVWLKQYTAGVPDTINPDAFSSLISLFEKYADEFAKKPVFSNFGVSMSYQKMKILVRDFAAFLQKELKLEKGDRLAIMMPNLMQYPVAIFGALKAGLIVVNVNPLYTAPELKKQLNDAGAKAIVVLENFANHLAEALPHTMIEHVILAKMGDLLGFAKGALINFFVRYIKGKVPDYHLTKAVFFNKALSRGKHLIFDEVSLSNNDIAFLQYTGGTTGVSKGAMLLHRNLIANVLQCVSWIRGTVSGNQGVVVGALPLYHIFSLTVCGMCVMPMGACTVLITNPRDTNAFIKEIRHAKITMMVGLNTLFSALLENPCFRKVDFSCLKLTVSGGMAMQSSVANRWQNVTGVPVLEGYGLTETSPVLTLCPVSVSHFTGSVGVPVPSTAISIRGDHDVEMPVRQQGEICAHGPQIMLGYWNQEKETRQVLNEEGWFRTGDIGYMDERGFLYIVDRKKDMVLVSGFNVYPNEVEEIISSHQGVSLVAVIGIPSEKTGEALKAFVVKKDPNLTQNELIAFCRKSLTGYKIPKYIEFRDHLPLSNVGKVLRRELKETANL